MTYQQNKQFNTYKEGLDLEFLREYCMEHGELHWMERGKTLEELALRIGHVEETADGIGHLLALTTKAFFGIKYIYSNNKSRVSKA